MDCITNQKNNKKSQGELITRGRAVAGAGTGRNGEPIQELIQRLYKTDPQIKKYIDYKIDYIKRGYENMIIDLYEEIAEKYKTIETLKMTYTQKEINELKAYYYQTPKNLNEMKGLNLNTIIKYRNRNRGE